jgi:hypothetical protein
MLTFRLDALFLEDVAELRGFGFDLAEEGLSYSRDWGLSTTTGFFFGFTEFTGEAGE